MLDEAVDVKRREPVPDDPADLCPTCGVHKNLHRDVAQAGTHDFGQPEPEPRKPTLADLRAATRAQPDETEPVDTDPWAERYPLITAAMGKEQQAQAVQAAATNLSEAGPEFEDQALELMQRAETLFSPFEAEVVAFVHEVVLNDREKE